MNKVVGLGEIVISNDPSDNIKTFALSTCVGIIAYCAKKQIAGMIHIVLPERPRNSETDTLPSYYASTGIPIFIQNLLNAGCKKGEISLKIYGGSKKKVKDHFNIGTRNLESVEKLLSEMEFSYSLEDVGGSFCRTISIDVSNGKIKMEKLPIYYYE
jgi:chemotaxis protein CheD